MNWNLPSSDKPKQRYVIHCDFCGFHKFTDGTDVKLVEIVRSPTPRGIPKLVPDGKGGKKTETPKPMPRSKQFKCPSCGRGVTSRVTNVKFQGKPNEQKIDTSGREAGPFGQSLSGDPPPRVE